MTTRMSYDHGPGDRPLLGETIGENFDRMATAHAGREALVDRSSGRRWTYAELHRDVLALAHGLLRLGIDQGDRVGIWAPNGPEWTLLQYATAEIGAILVPLNPAYRTSELAYVVNQAGIRLLVAAPSFRTSDYAAMIEDVRPGCPDLRWVVLLGSADWHALPDPAGDPDALEERQARLSPDDPINIQHTSGTTGHPKGATLSHHNILNNAHLIGEILGYAELDRICVPVPLYHTFGMVIGNLGATTHGACLVYPAPAFDPKATLAAVAEERCTSLYGVPTMFIAELAEPGFDDYDLSSCAPGSWVVRPARSRS
jgi:fatty-acyl-CoA synthase